MREDLWRMEFEEKKILKIEAQKGALLARRRACGRKLLESESDTGDRYQIARRKKKF